MDEPIKRPDENINQETKNLTLLIWLGTTFLGFIPSLLSYLLKKDDAYLLDQSKEALNWSITVAIAYFAAMVLTVLVIGAFLFPLIGLCHLVICIMGAVAVSKGEVFRVPFGLRLIK